MLKYSYLVDLPVFSVFTLIFISFFFASSTLGSVTFKMPFSKSASILSAFMMKLSLASETSTVATSPR